MSFRFCHILDDGTTEASAQTEKRLVREMGVSRTLFEPDLTTNNSFNSLTICAANRSPTAPMAKEWLRERENN